MILVKPSFEIMEVMGVGISAISKVSGMNLYHRPLHLIEQAGRTCYKSEDKITNDSAESSSKK